MSDTHRGIVEQANAAFAKSDTEAFLGLCTDDVVWSMVGDQTVSGKEQIRKWMASMGGDPPRVTVDQIVVDGDSAIAEGQMTMADGSGRQQSYAYCDVYRFRGGRIAELRAYVINTDKQDSARE